MNLFVIINLLRHLDTLCKRICSIFFSSLFTILSFEFVLVDLIRILIRNCMHWFICIKHNQLICYNYFVDACSSQANCGQNTVCQAKNHGAICRCRDGFYGDPIAGCRSKWEKKIIILRLVTGLLRSLFKKFLDIFMDLSQNF